METKIIIRAKIAMKAFAKNSKNSKDDDEVSFRQR